MKALKYLRNLSDGGKQPTQSDSNTHPLAYEAFVGLFVSCLQIWQKISSLQEEI